jgi:poly(A) polymerase
MTMRQPAANSRTEGVMASPLFPALVELYRCDESSSFKGLDGYYESSAAYRSYLRYQHSPTVLRTGRSRTKIKPRYIERCF